MQVVVTGRYVVALVNRGPCSIDTDGADAAKGTLRDSRVSSCGKAQQQKVVCVCDGSANCQARPAERERTETRNRASRQDSELLTAVGRAEVIEAEVVGMDLGS